MKKVIQLISILSVVIFFGCQKNVSVHTVRTDSNSPSPIVTVKVYFKTGSSSDPINKKGLNNLTAGMMAGSRTDELNHQQIQDLFFPIAAEINYSAEKEVTVFTASVHHDHLKTFLPVFLSKIFKPVFTQENLNRSRESLISYLSEELPGRNDEHLAKIGLEYLLFDQHPYQYPAEGMVNDLYNISLDDIVQHHQSLLSLSNVSIGLSGSISDDDQSLISDFLNDIAFHDLQKKSTSVLNERSPGKYFVFIENNSPSVSMSIGTPISLTRRDKDFYALLAANSFLGEHRTFHGLLMNEIRTKRGLNYGDYSYIEHWVEDIADQPYESSHIVRQQQYFSIWLRTTGRANAPFVLKTALSVYDRWIENGLTEEEFEITKSYLKNYSKLWTQSPERRLAFKMDSEFYQMTDYISAIDSNLSMLTVDDVNAAIKKYFTDRPLFFSIVGADAEELQQLFFTTEPTLPVYQMNSQISDSLKEEDNLIGQPPLVADSVRVVRAEDLFEE